MECHAMSLYVISCSLFGVVLQCHDKATSRDVIAWRLKRGGLRIRPSATSLRENIKFLTFNF